MGRVSYEDISVGDVVRVSYRASEFADTKVTAEGKLAYKDGPWFSLDGFFTMSAELRRKYTFELIKKAYPEEPPAGSYWALPNAHGGYSIYQRVEHLWVGIDGAFATKHFSWDKLLENKTGEKYNYLRQKYPKMIHGFGHQLLEVYSASDR